MNVRAAPCFVFSENSCTEADRRVAEYFRSLAWNNKTWRHRGRNQKKKYWPRLKTNDINDTRVLFHGQWKMRRKIILAAEGIVERARQFWDARWKAWINFAWRTLPLVPHLGKKGWTRLRAASYSVTMRALHHSRRPVNTTYWSSNIWLSMLLD